MKTKLTMQMPEGLEARDVEITGVVILPENEYQTVLATGQLPDRYLDRLKKYTEAVTPPRSCMISEYKALLVLSEDSENGVAVCGKDHVSYASVFPNARELLDKRIRKMTDFACSLKDVPDYSSHLVPLEMLGDYGKMKVTADNGTGELLLKELQAREEITDIIMHEDCFEINYYLDNVQDCVPPEARFMTLMGLIGCNLEEFHLCHCDEEHDLATIVELYPDTLTEQGRKDWADVLAAKVERIYNGYYGIQINVSGCDAERLRDFSYMLAGHCSVSDYDRWVNSDDGYHEKAKPDEEESSGMTMQ